jgi:hypothetical protein
LSWRFPFAGQKCRLWLETKKPQAVLPAACEFMGTISWQPRQIPVKIIPEVKAGSVCFAEIHFKGSVYFYSAKPHSQCFVKHLYA